jgi:hypothetical protein
MITDPSTTPSSVRGQVAFGAAVAAVYGVLMSLHVVFGLFLSLSLVCAVRGVALLASGWVAESSRVTAHAEPSTIRRAA